MKWGRPLPPNEAEEPRPPAVPPHLLVCGAPSRPGAEPSSAALAPSLTTKPAELRSSSIPPASRRKSPTAGSWGCPPSEHTDARIYTHTCTHTLPLTCWASWACTRHRLLSTKAQHQSGMTPFVYIVDGETGPERRRPVSSLAAFGGRAPGRVLGREEFNIEVSSATREARGPAGWLRAAHGRDLGRYLRSRPGTTEDLVQDISVQWGEAGVSEAVLRAGGHLCGARGEGERQRPGAEAPLELSLKNKGNAAQQATTTSYSLSSETGSAYLARHSES